MSVGECSAAEIGTPILRQHANPDISRYLVASRFAILAAPPRR